MSLHEWLDLFPFDHTSVGNSPILGMVRSASARMNFQGVLYHSILIFSERYSETEKRDLQHLKGLGNLVIPMGVAVTLIASLGSAEAAVRYYHDKAENYTLKIHFSSTCRSALGRVDLEASS